MKKSKTLYQLIHQVGQLYDLHTGDIHVFNRDLIILGLEKAIALTGAKRKHE